MEEVSNSHNESLNESKYIDPECYNDDLDEVKFILSSIFIIE